MSRFSLGQQVVDPRPKRTPRRGNEPTKLVSVLGCLPAMTSVVQVYIRCLVLSSEMIGFPRAATNKHTHQLKEQHLDISDTEGLKKHATKTHTNKQHIFHFVKHDWRTKIKPLCPKPFFAVLDEKAVASHCLERKNASFRPKKSMPSHGFSMF